MKTIRAGTVEIAYFEEEHGPLVLLLQGFPDTAHGWAAAAGGHIMHREHPERFVEKLLLALRRVGVASQRAFLLPAKWPARQVGDPTYVK